MSPRSQSATRRKPAPPRQAPTRRPFLALGIAVLLGAGIAFAVSRFDVGRAIQELTLPLHHEDIIRQQAAEKSLDPALVAAVIYSESRFHDQTSSKGAIGLMQITPATAKGIERLSGGTTFVTSDLSDPEINISYGCFYLRHLLDHYGGSQVAALAAYNAGIGNVDSWGGSGLTLADIPFPETRAYVEEVLQKRDEYASKYAADLGL